MLIMHINYYVFVMIGTVCFQSKLSGLYKEEDVF